MKVGLYTAVVALFLSASSAYSSNAEEQTLQGEGCKPLLEKVFSNLYDRDLVKTFQEDFLQSRKMSDAKFLRWFRFLQLLRQQGLSLRSFLPPSFDSTLAELSDEEQAKAIGDQLFSEVLTQNNLFSAYYRSPAGIAFMSLDGLPPPKGMSRERWNSLIESFRNPGYLKRILQINSVDRAYESDLQNLQIVIRHLYKRLKQSGFSHRDSITKIHLWLLPENDDSVAIARGYLARFSEKTTYMRRSLVGAIKKSLVLSILTATFFTLPSYAEVPSPEYVQFVERTTQEAAWMQDQAIDKGSELLTQIKKKIAK